MTQEQLPDIVEKLKREHPAIWNAFNQLGEAAGEAGPLDDRTERLVKLALAIGGRLEGAVRAHVRRAKLAGISRQELEQVAMLAITSTGWPNALAAYSWICDELEQ